MMNNGEGLQLIVVLIIADAEVEASISEQEPKPRDSLTYSSFCFVSQQKKQNGKQS